MKEFSKLIVFFFFWSYSHAFFEEFAIFHDRQAIKIYFNKTSTTEVRTWFRRYDFSINYYVLIFRNFKSSITTTYVIESSKMITCYHFCF